MPMPQVGDVAPPFTLMDQDGNTVRSSDHQGRQVVLYFYPKDDTPGCTREACAFRDDHALLSQANVVVLGVSADDTRSHKRFAEKFRLPFPLLADTDHQLAEAYGVWVEKNMYGRKSMGIQRATFLIGPDGRLARVWPKVKVDAHAAEVREAVGIAAPGGAPTKAGAEAAASAAGVRRTTASGARKTASKKTATRRAPAKQAAAKKAPARKAAAKKAPARKAAAKKAPARKAAGGRRSTTAGAEATPGVQHKMSVLAKRGSMKPGRNAPAGGKGPGTRHLPSP